MSAEVTYRPLQEADLPMVRAWRNDPEVARYMYSDRAIGAEEHAAWYGRVKDDQTARYWVILLEGKPVGIVNLVAIDPDRQSASWAFYLADPSTRGKGIGLFVEYCVLAYAFDTVGLARLDCEVLVTNEAVCALHESVGFTRTGLLKERCLKQGSPVDAVAYQMQKDQWHHKHRPALLERLGQKGRRVDPDSNPLAD